MQPSPHDRRVGIRIATFEACSGFTRVTARRIAQPPKATFVARLRPGQLPDQAARQLPDLSTIIRWNPPPLMIRAFGAHCQRTTWAPLSAHAEGRWHDDRAWQEAELEDDGDQAVMRGLGTAFPFIRPGLSLSLNGRRSPDRASLTVSSSHATDCYTHRHPGAGRDP